MRSSVIAVICVAISCYLVLGADPSRPLISFLIDNAQDWSGSGRPYTDILTASVTRVGTSLVFSATLAGVVPERPDFCIAFDFLLDLGDGLGRIWVGVGCNDAAKEVCNDTEPGIWSASIGRWNEDWTEHTLFPLPAGSFHISYSTILIVVPLSELSPPPVFQWSAIAHFDDCGEDVRDWAPDSGQVQWPGGISVPLVP